MYIHVYTIYMTTKISKWGNSYAIRIPKNILDKFNLSDGSEIDVIEEGNEIKLKPKVKIRGKYDLETLLSQLSKVDEVVDWGGDVGKEIID